MSRNVAFQILRGVFANMPALMVGELYFTTDTTQLYIGTGSGNLLLAPSSGGGNAVQATVDFGFHVAQEGDTARTTVSAPWVQATSKIVCSPFAVDTPEHNPDDVVIEGIEAYAENIVAGVGFDIVVYAPQNSFGRYVINAIGV